MMLAIAAYNIFRWYRAGWGRYTQADPIGVTQFQNLFAYVAGNPLSFIDPLGLFAVTDRDARNQRNATIMCDGSGNVVPYFPHSWRRTEEWKCFSECVRMHEQSHVNDVNRVNPGICRGERGYRMIRPTSFPNMNEVDETERRAWRVYRRCLGHQSSRFSSCDPCQPVLRREIGRADDVLRDESWRQSL